MAANTSRGITFPTSGDSITPLETVFATMANTTNTALGAINAGTDITAGTLPIARGGTGGTTQATAQAALGVVPLSSHFVAGKNAIINGAFDVWQRTTTSNSTTAPGYWADRWRYTATGGSAKVLSQSRENFTPGTAPVAGYESRSFLRVAVSTGGSGFTYEAVEQPIEDVRTCAGSTVTISFWAKTTSSTLNFTPRLTQFFGTGGSADTVVTGSSISVTTSWTRFTQTLTVPSVTGKTIVDTNSALIFAIVPNTFNSIYTLDLWGVQVEQGSIATPFATASETIGGELALCQRYYYRATNALAATGVIGAGVAISTTTGWINVKFPMTMRSAPAAIEISAAATTFTAVSTTTTAASSVTLGESTADGSRIVIAVASGLTSGGGCMARFAGTAGTGFLGFSAEL
jgi:hypothetical protein